ncbi:hypothetical protein [Brucella melitensis]|uniref:hypothetical protein n=1 Tax=Brucella melitensis TaxID=29459 RepID=UPI000B42DBED|nr:hypothetical protein [Brucella melitensis]ARZ09121.1 hypothetical protein BK148_17075 [Brucella melitensis]
MRGFPVAFARCDMKRDVKWFSARLAKKRMRASLAIMISSLRACLRHLAGQGACLVNTGAIVPSGNFAENSICGVDFLTGLRYADFIQKRFVFLTWMAFQVPRKR